MKHPIFKGSCVALVTPFTDDGVNYEKLEELIEWQIEQGTDAILICGTTGEASTMPDPEHKAVIRFAVEKIKGRVHVMAGAGSNDTKHAVELSKFAQSAGADSILSVTPYYNKTTQEGLYQHFKAIADAVTIPVVLYNVPSRTNLNICPDTLKRLSEIENITAVKECNLAQVARTIQICGDNMTIYSGEDGNVVPLMALGGYGVISVMANIIPADTHKMAAAFLEGDLETSRQIQIKTVNLVDALFCEVNPIPVKAAMNLMGMNVGKCRMPLVDISAKGLETVRNALAEYGLI
ncbi:MAG: 4-hydroxy-tetrahydrodipicolinate synthase [Bacillota bacterium]|jgi:4-hydroxy-tetrahydrodipicolinate synthase|nr:4-hydroxy-tetrahydrodipicolinate synthase [Bacillota bacterium]NLV64007.1 4-hydroxy-tetrahydrodipicolinate synthase [Clostridiaceae bacterium]